MQWTKHKQVAEGPILAFLVHLRLALWSRDGDVGIDTRRRWCRVRSASQEGCMWSRSRDDEMCVMCGAEEEEEEEEEEKN